jgi:putative isomerase
VVKDLSFGGLLHYACVTGRSVLDYTQTGLEGFSTISLLDADGNSIPTSSRNIVFEPFGWKETAALAGLEAESSVCFVATDAYLQEVTIKNSSEKPVTITPVVSFQATAAEFSASFHKTQNAVVFSGRVLTSGSSRKNRLAVNPSFGVSSLERDRKAKFFRASGRPQTLGPYKSWSFQVMYAYSPDHTRDALRVLTAASRTVATSQEPAFPAAAARWKKFFDSLPPPHTGEDRFVELYRLAATALRMCLYAPRGSMTGWGAVPTKVHYNWFWLWDSAFEALGISEFDPGVAEQVLTTMMKPQSRNGFLAHMTNENLKRLTSHSQSPVIAWAASQIGGRDPDVYRRLSFVKAMKTRGERYLSWWASERDKDHDGLFEFISQDEGGWDNSPRMNYVDPIVFLPYQGSLGEILAAKVEPLDAVDCNAWIYLYDQALAKWSTELHDEIGARKWRSRAEELSRKIDDVLWDENMGCWTDAYRTKGASQHTHWEVLTPAIWFPAFADASRNLTRVRKVIEEHLLNPKEFFGKYAIPTVAYDDPRFDLTTPGWKGYIWLVTLYSALPTLFRYGYEDKARELAYRTLDMMASQGGMKGVWETYDPLTGSYKNEYSNGDYCSFQFGWSSAFVMEILLERYQENCFVFDETRSISGHIRRAEIWGKGSAFYEVKSYGSETPFIRIRSLDDAPLLASRKIELTAEDPYHAFVANGVDCTILGRNYHLAFGTSLVVETTPGAR